MNSPVFKIPQRLPTLPDWLQVAVEAANDNVELTAREVAKTRWLSQTESAAQIFFRVGGKVLGHALFYAQFLEFEGDTAHHIPVVDKPPVGKALPQWLTEMVEMATLASLMATKRNEAMLHRQNGQEHLARQAEQDLESLQTQVQTNIGFNPFLDNPLQIKASASDSSALAMLSSTEEGAAENGDDDLSHPPLQAIARDQLDKISDGSLQQLTRRPRHTVSDVVAYVRHSWPRWLVSDPVLLSVLVPPSVAAAVVSGMKVYQSALQGGESLLGSVFSGTVMGGIAGGACFMAGGFALISLAALGVPDNSSVIKDVIDLRARGSFRLARSLVANSMNSSTRPEYRRHVEFDIAVSRATLAMDAGDYAAAVKLMRPVIEFLDQVDVERYDVQFRATASSRSRLYPAYGVALLRNGSYAEASRILKKAADDRMSTFMDLTNGDIQMLATVAAHRSAQYLLHVTENDAEAIADPQIATLVAGAKVQMQAKEYRTAEELLLQASALAEERYNHTADEIALHLLGMTIESRDNVEGEKARKRADAALIQEERAIRDTLSILLDHQKDALRLRKNGLEFVVARAQLMLDHGRYLEATSILTEAVCHTDIEVHRVDWRQGIDQYESYAYLNDRERAEVYQMLGVAELAAGKVDSARGIFAYAAEKFDQLGAAAKAEDSRRWQRMAAHRLGRRAITPEIAALEQKEAAEHMVRAVDLESKGLFSRANREYSAALDIYEALDDASGMREALTGQEEIAMALGDATTAFQIARFKMTLKRPQ